MKNSTLLKKTFNDEWKNWIHTNVNAGRDKNGIFKILLDEGYSYSAIRDEMKYEPTIPIDQLVNPLKAREKAVNEETEKSAQSGQSHDSQATAKINKDGKNWIQINVDSGDDKDAKGVIQLLLDEKYYHALIGQDRQEMNYELSVNVDPQNQTIEAIHELKTARITSSKDDTAKDKNALTQFNDEWRDWIWHNVNQGHDKNGIFKILLDEGFVHSAIAREMKFEPDRPVDQLVNPFEQSQRQDKRAGDQSDSDTASRENDSAKGHNVKMGDGVRNWIRRNTKEGSDKNGIFKILLDRGYDYADIVREMKFEPTRPTDQLENPILQINDLAKAEKRDTDSAQATDKSDSADTLKMHFDENWKEWIRNNVARGCSKNGIFKILLDEGYAYTAIVKEMNFKPTVPVDELVNPFDKQRQQEQGSTQEAVSSDAAEKDSSESKLKTEFNADWQGWIRHNIDRGCDKNGIFKILLDEGFAYPAIVKEMNFKPTVPVDELVNPFDKQRQQEQGSTQEAVSSDAAEKDSSESKLKTEFNADWQGWIRHNIDRGCDKNGIFKILLDEGFAYPAIVKEMNFKPTVPVDELVNPFDKQRQQEQDSTQEAVSSDAAEKDSSESNKLKTEFNADWQGWIRHNIDRGCDKNGIFKILLDEGYAYSAIAQQMNFKPTLPLEELVNPLALKKKREQAKNLPIEIKPLFLSRAKKVDTNKVEMFVVDDFFNLQECDTVIDLIRKDNSPSRVTGDQSDPMFRTSNTCYLGSLNNEFIKKLDDRMCQFLGVHSAYSESMQGQIYEIGQEFKRHTDFFAGDDKGKYTDKQGQRTYTFMVYLNDVEQGGETYFPHIDVRFKPKRGQAVIWSNLHLDGSHNLNTLHQGMAPKSGFKAIITKWFRARDPECKIPSMYSKTVFDYTPSYAPQGFTKTTLSKYLHNQLRDFYRKQSKSANAEYTDGRFVYSETNKDTGSHMINLSAELSNSLIESLKPTLEVWSHQDLEPVCVYGIRRYDQGAILRPHRDIIGTHIISAIINVDQDVDEDWPLVINDHFYREHQVIMKPGDVVLYEGARLTHSRPFPLKGRSFVNIFVHFRPKSYVPRLEKVAVQTVGQSVADFFAPATTSKNVALSAYRGSNVVLFFYPKDDTAGCTREAKEFSRIYPTFRNANTHVFGVSRDCLESHELFKAKYNLPFDLIADTDEYLCHLFGILKLTGNDADKELSFERSTFLIDKQGVLRKAWRGVTIDGHAQDVLEAVKNIELENPEPQT